MDAGVPPHPGGVWIKRDDLSGTLYGGNKVRKLEFLLGDARHRGCDTLWTFGAIGSHHALATALYGRQLGMQTHVTHFPQPVTEHVLRNLRAIIAAGAHLHPTPSMSAVAPLAAAQLLRYRLTSRRRPCVIPSGGSNPVGALGYVNAALELAAQLRDKQLPTPSRLYVATGTAGTFAGLWLGLRLAGLEQIEVVGVRVVGLSFANPFTVAALIRATSALLHDLDPSIPKITPSLTEIAIRHAYFGEGYGFPTPLGGRAMALFQRARVRLDPTYTAKTAAALLDELLRPNLRPRGPILFWHTLSAADIDPLVHATRVPEDIPEPYRRFFEAPRPTP